jgi:uncharacterized protein YndB with AHSA1/START domain
VDLDPKTDLSFTRTLPVPRQLVWECWTTPKHFPHFFVPRPHTVKNVEIDLRPGGRSNSVFVVDGAEIPQNGVYLEVIEGKKLVFTDFYTEGWKPAPEGFMTAIIELEDTADGGTKYTATARHRTPETRESHEQMGFYDGWGTVVDQLVEYIQNSLMK